MPAPPALAARRIRWTVLIVATTALGTSACGPAPGPQAAPEQHAVRGEAHGEVAPRIAGILRMPEPLPRYAALSEALADLGPDDAPAVIDAFESTYFTPIDIESLIASLWLGRVAPEVGLAWARRGGAPADPTAFNRLFRGWASHDPAAARAAVEELPTPLQLEASRGMIEGWEASGIDAEGLDTFLREMGIGPQRQQALHLVAWRKAIRLGPEALMAWADGLVDSVDRYKLDAVRQVASVLGYLDPAQAARWAERHMDGQWGSRVPATVAKRWVKQDGRAALEWALALPDHPERTVALEDGYLSWLRQDRPGALAFAAGLDPDDPGSEPVRTGYLVALSRDDPPATLAALDTLRDPDRRERVTFIAVRRWIEADPDAAEAWMAEHELEPSNRERLEAALARVRERADEAPPG